MAKEFDELLKEYEEYKAKRRQLGNPLERIGEMRNQLESVRASVTSPRGGVTVVAGPGGSVQSIQISDQARQQPGAALAAEIMTALQQAVAASARQQAVIVDEHIDGGGEFSTADLVLRDQAKAFGTSVEQLKASLPDGDPLAPKAAKPARDPEADFGEQSLMGKGHRPPPPPPASAPPASSGSSAGDKFLKNLFAEDED